MVRGAANSQVAKDVLREGMNAAQQVALNTASRALKGDSVKEGAKRDLQKARQSIAGRLDEAAADMRHSSSAKRKRGESITATADGDGGKGESKKRQKKSKRKAAAAAASSSPVGRRRKRFGRGALI